MPPLARAPDPCITLCSPFVHCCEYITLQPRVARLTKELVQLPGKIVGILKSSVNRDDIEVLVSMGRLEDAPSQSHPGRKTKVRVPGSVYCHFFVALVVIITKRAPALLADRSMFVKTLPTTVRTARGLARSAVFTQNVRIIHTVRARSHWRHLNAMSADLG